MRAWTLGTPGHYERAVRVPGNAKAPGGYAFRTREEAERYNAEKCDGRYAAWEMDIPGDDFDAATTDDYVKSARARHRWHTTGAGARPFMAACEVCLPIDRVELDCRLLLVAAPLINPDTGTVVKGSPRRASRGTMRANG